MGLALRARRRLLLNAVDIVERLGRLEWRKLGVCHVLLVGSLARRGVGRDVDLLVLPCGGKHLDMEEKLRVMLTVSDALGIDPDQVDVIVLDEAPCPLLEEAARHNVILYTVDQGALIDELLRRLGVCEDEAISSRKLNVIETAVRAALRRWGPRASLRDSTTRSSRPRRGSTGSERRG